MIDLNIGPGEPIVRPLLQVERVELIGLRRRTGHEAVENSRIVFYTGAVKVGKTGRSVS